MIESNDYPKTALDRVFEEVANLFSIEERKNIKITRITPQARRVWTETWKPTNQRQPPNGGWDWVFKNKFFCRGDNKYLFDMAIWEDQTILAGLVLGKLSKKTLSIYYLEANPNPQHGLKGLILPIIFQAALEYAKLSNRKLIRLIDPVPSLIPVYQQYGFHYQEKTLFGTPFCEKKIEDAAS
jgi:hypothetical protein